MHPLGIQHIAADTDTRLAQGHTRVPCAMPTMCLGPKTLRALVPLLLACCVSWPCARCIVMQVGAQALYYTWPDILGQLLHASVEVTWYTPTYLRSACAMRPILFDTSSIRSILGCCLLACYHCAPLTLGPCVFLTPSLTRGCVNYFHLRPTCRAGVCLGPLLGVGTSTRAVAGDGCCFATCAHDGIPTARGAPLLGTLPRLP